MSNFKLKDCLLLLLKSVIIAIFLCPIFIGLIKFNIYFSKTICTITKIPEDLSLTLMSIGFKNNILVLLTIFEVVILIYLFSKISKINFIKRFLKLFNTN